jgi:hypothetical protein
MSGMERLRDVWGREFDQDPLSSLRLVFLVFQAKISVQPEGFLLLKDRGYQDFGELVDFEEELEECAIACWFMHKR